jgi:hypothetical protein
MIDIVSAMSSAADILLRAEGEEGLEDNEDDNN